MSSRKQLVLIDDNAMVLKAMAAMLRAAGWEVATATTFEDGMSQLRAIGTAAIVDRTLATNSASEAADVIRREFPTLPLVVVSGGGFAESTSADPLRRELAKPFRPAELLETLSDLGLK